MLNKTFILQKEKTASGFEVSKDSIMLFLTLWQNPNL